MNKTEHTPGPWGYEDPMGPEILTIVANPSAPVYEWVWVAQISTEGVEDEDGTVRDKRPFAEHEANARLIAAAPEMLAALKELRKQAGAFLPLCEPEGSLVAACAAADTAISRATGQAGEG